MSLCAQQRGLEPKTATLNSPTINVITLLLFPLWCSQKGILFASCLQIYLKAGLTKRKTPSLWIKHHMQSLATLLGTHSLHWVKSPFTFRVALILFGMDSLIFWSILTRVNVNLLFHHMPYELCWIDLVTVEAVRLH